MKNVITKTLTQFPNGMKPADTSELVNITGEDYRKRINKALELAKNKYTHLFIYADREHFWNMEFFTGYDPRFEEAVLILQQNKKPALVVGNEGVGYAAKIPFEFDMYVLPTFSLPGQPRDKNAKLSNMLTEIGLASTSKVGVIGFKGFSTEDYENYKNVFDLPSFIMDELTAVVPRENLENAVDLMINNDDGLRCFLDVKELILSEYASTNATYNTYNVISQLKEGISEIEAASNLNIGGEPTNVHPNVNFGENMYYGLASPTFDKKLKRGQLAGVGMAYRRSLSHKVSFFVENQDELSPDQIQLMNTYYLALDAWYCSLKIGAKGKDVYNSVLDVVKDFKEVGIGLNPGHLIHTDEWTNSPFTADCESTLKSGMMIQCDFTSSVQQKNFQMHAEDGVIIADQETQAQIQKIAPKAYQRMINRREFMRKELGICVDDCVLPTGDMPAVLWPHLMDLTTVLAIEN